MKPSIPTAEDAERAFLGACLLSEDAIDRTRDAVTVDDFFAPKNKHVFAAILKARLEGEVDAVTVVAADPTIDMTYLAELQVATPAISSAPKYAAAIVDASRRRDLIRASSEIARLAQEAFSADEAVASATGLVAQLERPSEDTGPGIDADSMRQNFNQPYDWLIPHFLERMDRMMVTAGEGSGKSTWLRQLAYQAACGIQPFNHEQVPPVSTLIVDMENQPRQIARELNKLHHVRPITEPELLRFESRPAGINLLGAADRRWLLGRIIANDAQLLVIGPLYKMFRGSASTGDFGGEDLAYQLTQAIDDLRERTGVAVLLEAHAPKGSGSFGHRDLAPRGSAVWMGWPEFGVAIREEGEQSGSYTLEHWRGQRDADRVFPRLLLRGEGRWPWTPAGMPDGTFRNAASG